MRAVEHAGFLFILFFGDFLECVVGNFLMNGRKPPPNDGVILATPGLLSSLAGELQPPQFLTQQFYFAVPVIYDVLILIRQLDGNKRD